MHIDGLQLVPLHMATWDTNDVLVLRLPDWVPGTFDTGGYGLADSLRTSLETHFNTILDEGRNYSTMDCVLSPFSSLETARCDTAFCSSIVTELLNKASGTKVNRLLGVAPLGSKGNLAPTELAQKILDAGAHIMLYMRSRTRPTTALHPSPWQIYPFGWKTRRSSSTKHEEHRANTKHEEQRPNREKYRLFLESVQRVTSQSTTGLTSESNCDAACEGYFGSAHLDFGSVEVVEMCKAAYGCAILANL